MVFRLYFFMLVLYYKANAVPTGPGNGVHSNITSTTIASTSTIAIEAELSELELKYLDYDVWCKLQPNANDCSGKGYGTTRYYYDIKLEDCKTFSYKKCGAYNSFDTITECHDSCRDAGRHLIRGNYSDKIFCRLQPDFGLCYEYHPMYYFDINSRSCKGFSYSGCGGNHNRFPNSKDCLATCLNLMESELTF